MKTIYKTIVLLSLCVVIFSCRQEKPTKSTEIYLLLDVTASAENSNKLNINAQKVANISGLNDNEKTLQLTYSHSTLSEVFINGVFSRTLMPAKQKGYNKFRRRNAIKEYLKSIDEEIAKLNSVEFDRPNSNLFVNINSTINKVAKNNADNQLVLIQSDLLDNSSLFSAYDSEQMLKLKKSPAFLINILEQHAPINQSLDKMDVIIVYQPIAKTDEAYRLISSIFKDYLISKNAKSVQIVANL